MAPRRGAGYLRRDRAPGHTCWWRIFIALLVGSLLSLPATAHASSSAGIPASADLLMRVVALTNAERQKAGLGPLVVEASLAAAAQNYAAVLASGECFGHNCGPVPDFTTRAVAAGYSDWTGLAENVAGGQPTPEQVVASWMASPGHRANILNGAYTEIGVGLATGGRYGIYWTQVFGARRGQPAPEPLAPAMAIAGRSAVPGCIFALGFAALRMQLGSIGGACLENERYNEANGNAEQATTTGLFVWRKADNWTAFTDGYHTWVNGPFGIQRRLNTQRFSWEV